MSDYKGTYCLTIEKAIASNATYSLCLIEAVDTDADAEASLLACLF